MDGIQPTAHSMPQSSYRAELTEVTRGTPMGAYLRRTWHTVCLASGAGNRPKKVRVLGEDLILFRDDKGVTGQQRAGYAYTAVIR